MNVVDPFSGATASPDFAAQGERFGGADVQAFDVDGEYTIDVVEGGLRRREEARAEGRARVDVGRAADGRRPPSTPDPGSAQAYAAGAVAARGWPSSEFDCLVALWNKESGWRVNAYNASSGAYGIPQALPGSKMATAGADWETNAGNADRVGPRLHPGPLRHALRRVGALAGRRLVLSRSSCTSAERSAGGPPRAFAATGRRADAASPPRLGSMARSNRSRGRAARAREEHPELDVERLTAGWRRTEVRGGREWNVQPVSEAQAVKAYLCPGCGLEVAPGVAHLVTWRADGVLGDAADLAARRHWHTHCWRIGP